MSKYTLNHLGLIPFRQDTIKNDAALETYASRMPHIYYNGKEQSATDLIKAHNNCLAIVGHSNKGLKTLSCHTGPGKDDLQRVSASEVIAEIRTTLSQKALYAIKHIDVVSCYGGSPEGFADEFIKQWNADKNLPAVDVHAFNIGLHVGTHGTVIGHYHECDYA